MRYFLFCAVTLFCGSYCFAVDTVSKKTQDKVQKIVDSTLENSLKVTEYCVAGKFESPNFDAKNDEPLSTVSDFVICESAAQKYRRHSVLKESINNGNLVVFDWFTRVNKAGKVSGGFDKNARQEFSISLLPDLELFELAVANTSDIRKERVLPGYLLKHCNPKQVVDYQEDLRGVLVTFQVGDNGHLVVEFSASQGNQPVYCAWKVSDAVSMGLKEAPKNDSYGMVICHTRTKWKEHDGVWYPVRFDIERCNSFLSKQKRVIEAWSIVTKWKTGKSLDFQLFDTLPSPDLWEFVASNADVTSE